NQTVIRTLFENMRTPAGQARNDKNWRKQGSWNAQEMVCSRVVEVGIREQFFLVPHDLFQTFGDRIQVLLVRVVAGKMLRPLLDDVIARIMCFVHAMSKAHDLVLVGQHLADRKSTRLNSSHVSI